MSIKKKLSLLTFFISLGCTSGRTGVSIFTDYTNLFSHTEGDKIKELKESSSKDFVSNFIVYGSDLLRDHMNKYAKKQMNVQSQPVKNDKSKSYISSLRTKISEKKNNERREKALSLATLNRKNLANCLFEMFNIYQKLWTEIFDTKEYKSMEQFFKEKIPDDINSFVDNAVAISFKKCKNENTYRNFVAYIATRVLVFISGLTVIIRTNINNPKASTLVNDCKKKLIQCCSLFYEKTQKALQKISGLNIDLYDLSQKTNQHRTIDFMKNGYLTKKDFNEENPDVHDYTMSIFAGSFNNMFTTLCLDCMAKSKYNLLYVKKDTYYDVVFSKNKKASLACIFQENYLTGVYFEDEVKPLRVIVEFLLESLYYKLAICVGNCNLLKKKTFIKNLKRSEDWTVVQLRNTIEKLSEIISNDIIFSNGYKKHKTSIGDKLSLLFNKTEASILFTDNYQKILTEKRKHAISYSLQE